MSATLDRMVLKDAATAIPAPAAPTADRHRAAATSRRRDLLPAALLALLALGLTFGYYAAFYQAQVLAEDRVRGLFVGFQSLEGEELGMPFRWTKGDGRFCFPAAGWNRPLAALELRLLGSSVQGIDRAGLSVGAAQLPLTLAPESRAYRLLIPPEALGGSVCVMLSSATVDPAGTGRVTGVGLRSAELTALERSLPPLGQLLANLWLAAGSYVLLRRFALPRGLALPLVLAVTTGIGVGLIGGTIRLAPDLPYWSGFAAVAVGAILGAVLAHQWAAPRLSEWQRETLGVALILALLTAGWVVISQLEGYFWPFPLMARGGTAFGWGVLPAVGLFTGFFALVLGWLRARQLPPAWLVIAVCALAAFVLPVALKAGLRGWESLYQHFAVQEGTYIDDVPRVAGDPLGFLRSYVALMPELALHNKTHPPGGTLFLWAVEQFFGPGPVPATWVVIALSALIVWPTHRLAAELLGERAALLAAAIVALLPAFLIYAATSMDALFAVVKAWAIYWLYKALVVEDWVARTPPAPFPEQEQGRAGSGASTLPAPSRGVSQRVKGQRQLLAAVGAGFWIALGLFFSFTTLMLALVVLALTVRRIAIGPRQRADVLRWAVVGGTIGGTVLLLLGGLYLATGYNSLAAFFTGMANNRLDVGARVAPLGLSSYLFFLAVNTVAYGWYLGPWIVYRLGQGGGAAIRHSAMGIDRQADALGVGMAALVLGMLFSGLFYREIERIWLFSHLLIAATLADGIMQRDDQRSRMALTALMLIILFLHGVVFRAALRVSW